MNIKEASIITGVSQDMLRHYEKLGIIAPRRNPANRYREYALEDLNNVVMMKQYSSLGISLRTLSSLSAEGDVSSASKELETAIRDLEKTLLLAQSKLDNAKDYYHLFSLIQAGIFTETGIRPSVYYYPRPETNPFFSDLDLDLHGAVRPVFRIKKKDITLPSYPVDQGFLSAQKIPSCPLPFSSIPAHHFWRTFFQEERDEMMTREKLLPILSRMESEGHTLKGCILLYQIMHANRSNPRKLICVECVTGPGSDTRE